MRKLICWFIGHRSIELHRHAYLREGNPWVEITSWKCECCGRTNVEQWDS